MRNALVAKRPTFEGSIRRALPGAKLANESIQLAFYRMAQLEIPGLEAASTREHFQDPEFNALPIRKPAILREKQSKADPCQLPLVFTDIEMVVR